jgi:signal transduction histidine kinase
VSRIFAVEGGRRSFDVEPVQIEAEQELRRLCETMQKVSGRDDIRFGFSFDPLAPRVTMDRDSFLFVFYALIDNAIKYSDPDSEITLECSEERPTGRYPLKVKSYGLPIAPSDTNRVFVKFQRGTGAPSRDETGLGIGCWAAKRHMELHNGRIELEVDGKLSVFIVYPPSPGRL